MGGLFRDVPVLIVETCFFMCVQIAVRALMLLHFIFSRKDADIIQIKDADIIQIKDADIIQILRFQKLGSFIIVLTLSLLGYLKASMFDVQIIQMIHHWKAHMLYFQNLQMQKNCKLSKINIFLQNPIIQKMRAKKVQTIINFLTMPFKICKTFGKVFITWCVIKKNQKCVNTPHAKNLQTFFAICYLISQAVKLKIIKILQLKVGQNKDLVCLGKKQSFRQCARGLRQ